MAYGEVLLYEPLRSIDSATFTGNYQALGTALAHACSIVKLINNSSVTVTISTDGIHDHDIAPANGFFLYDETTNRTSSSAGAFDPVGTQYYVKGASGTGLVYLVVKYLQVN
jgi:hypothetical protein